MPPHIDSCFREPPPIDTPPAKDPAPTGEISETTQGFARPLQRVRCTGTAVPLEWGPVPVAASLGPNVVSAWCVRTEKGPVADELPECPPGSDPVGPREPDQDDEPNDLADLDIRVVEQRLEPPVHVEGGHRERPSVRRIPDDGRLIPNQVEQKVRGDPEADESEDAQRRNETEGEDCEQEEERVRPET